MMMSLFLVPISHSIETREKLLECVSKAGYRPEELEIAAEDES